MRYLVVFIIAVIIIAAAAPAYSHGGDRLDGEVSIEVTSESESTLLSILHEDSWKRWTHIMALGTKDARPGPAWGSNPILLLFATNAKIVSRSTQGFTPRHIYSR